MPMMSVDDLSSYNNKLVYEPSLSPKSQFTPSNIQMIMKAKKQTFEFTNATILFLSHVFLFPPFSSLISCSSIMTIIMMAACLPMTLQTSFILFLTPFLHGLIIPSLLSITRIRMRIRMNTIFPSCRFSLHFLIKIVSILLVLLIPFPMEMDSSLSQDISPTGLSSCVSILMSVSIPLCCWASPKPLMMWVFLQSISNRSFSLSPSPKEVDAKQYDIYNRNTIHAFLFGDHEEDCVSLSPSSLIL